MRTAILMVILWLSACGAASVPSRSEDASDTGELERAITALERDVALESSPMAWGLLALASERAGHPERAREALAEMGTERPASLHLELSRLEERLASQLAGGPYVADEALRARIIGWVHEYETRRERPDCEAE